MTISSMDRAPLVIAALSAGRTAGRWGGLPYHLLAGAGAVLVILGSYMPWATFYAGLVERNGVSGHGKYFIALAAVALAASVASRVRGAAMLRWLVPAAGLAIGAVAVRDLRNLRLLLDDPGAAFYVPSVGDGLYVVIAGAALLAAAAFVAPVMRAPLRIRSTALLALALLAGGLLIAGGYGEYYLHTAPGSHVHHAGSLRTAHILTGGGGGLLLMLASAGTRMIAPPVRQGASAEQASDR